MIVVNPLRDLDIKPLQVIEGSRVMAGCQQTGFYTPILHCLLKRLFCSPDRSWLISRRLLVAPPISVPVHVRFQGPREGYKINTDAALFSQLGCTGFGAVLSSSQR
ncbi:hypothetical protein QYF36_001203 [Acer negundo]|nr:hypothetical protein QYF36_001203 [Acer negundo]